MQRCRDGGDAKSFAFVIVAKSVSLGGSRFACLMREYDWVGKILHA